MVGPARYVKNIKALCTVVNGEFTETHLRYVVAGTNLPADGRTASISHKAIELIKSKPGNRFYLVNVAAKAYWEAIRDPGPKFVSFRHIIPGKDTHIYDP